MSPHELQQKLLEYYTLHYKVVEGMEDLSDIESYLLKNGLSLGVCHVSRVVFNEKIFDKTYRGYWGVPPVF